MVAVKLCILHHGHIFVVSFISFIQEWQITTLSFEEDPEPFGKERDAAISALAQEAGVETVVRTSHTLFNLKK